MYGIQWYAPVYNRLFLERAKHEIVFCNILAITRIFCMKNKQIALNWILFALNWILFALNWILFALNWILFELYWVVLTFGWYLDCICSAFGPNLNIFDSVFHWIAFVD